MGNLAGIVVQRPGSVLAEDFLEKWLTISRKVNIVLSNENWLDLDNLTQFLRRQKPDFLGVVYFKSPDYHFRFR